MLALQSGVDVKTLSTMLGHYSAGFTLDTYAHITISMQSMQKQAADKIDQGIGKVEIPMDSSYTTDNHTMTNFKAQWSKHRYWGSGFPG